MPPKRKSRKAAAAKAVNLNDVDALIGQFSKASSTNNQYAGVLRKADEWLPEHISQLNQGTMLPSFTPSSFEHMPPKNIFSGEAARFAFREPTECTPQLLAMYLYNECIIRANGRSTADQIRAAFLLRFERL